MRKALVGISFILLFNSKLFAQVSNEQIYKFNRVMDLISMFYVDSIQENKLVEKAIISILKDLDPHSVYLNKDEAREFNEPLLGSFDGIGITFNILRDTVYIVSTFQDGPSQRMGIKAGDRIIAINDKNVAGIGITNEQVKTYLIGAGGTNVSLKIKPYRKSSFSYVSVPREQITISSIDAAYQLDNSTAYIRLNKFSANSIEEFTNISRKFKKKGIDNLILDLRDNGGGYLKAATDLADHFLPDDKLMVYTLGTSNPKAEYVSETKGLFEKGKLIILINENTASASEIVCGAVQDWDRGIIMGRRSFGKGLVQRQFNLSDGSSIRLTVARYYTPTGRLIQKSYSDGYDKYSEDIKQRYKHGEFFSADSININDTIKYYTLTNHRTVYGGGGIIPDIFISLDTMIYPGFYRKLMKNGKLFEFVLDYTDRNMNELTFQYPDFNKYKNDYTVTDETLRKLVRFAFNEESRNEEGKDLLAFQSGNLTYPNDVNAEYSIESPFLRNHVKALIAQNIYGISEYYQVLNSLDQVVLKALEVMKDEDRYQSILNYK